MLGLIFLASCQAIPITPPIQPPEATITPTYAPLRLATPTPTSLVSIPAPEDLIRNTDFHPRLAWFYKPPTNTNLAEVANNFDFFIMSKGNEEERNILQTNGAKPPMLRYIRFDAIMDPKDCEKVPAQNQAAFMPGDFCEISAQHPDWFLMDRAGNRIVRISGSSGKNYYFMDPGNSGWRVFFVERLWQVYREDPHWDGVFLDNVETSFRFRKDRNQVPAEYPSESAYVAAIQDFVQYIRVEFAQKNRQALYGNLVARSGEADFINHIAFFDGVMHESWSTSYSDGYRSPVEWEAQMKVAEQTQASGKIIILVAQGQQADLEMQRFSYASYLLANQGRAVFRYTNGDYYSEAWFYDNYAFEIGAPLGPRYQDGNIWRRDFSYGSVTVDPYNHAATITITNK